MKQKKQQWKRVISWVLCMMMVFTSINLPENIVKVDAAAATQTQGTAMDANDVANPQFDQSDKIASKAAWDSDGVTVYTAGEEEYLFVQWQESGVNKVYTCKAVKGTVNAGTIGGEGFVLDSGCNTWIGKKDAETGAVSAKKLTWNRCVIELNTSLFNGGTNFSNDENKCDAAYGEYQIYQNGSEAKDIQGNSIPHIYLNRNNLNSENNCWTRQVEVPRYDDAGYEYHYTVNEVQLYDPHGVTYTTKRTYQVSTIEVEGEEVPCIFTTFNSYVGSTNELRFDVQKVWKDGEDIASRKPSVIQLYYLGEDPSEDTPQKIGGDIVITAQDNWEKMIFIEPVNDDAGRYAGQYVIIEAGLMVGENLVESDFGDKKKYDIHSHVASGTNFQAATIGSADRAGDNWDGLKYVYNSYLKAVKSSDETCSYTITDVRTAKMDLEAKIDWGDTAAEDKKQALGTLWRGEMKLADFTIKKDGTVATKSYNSYDTSGITCSYTEPVSTISIKNLDRFDPNGESYEYHFTVDGLYTNSDSYVAFNSDRLCLVDETPYTVTSSDNITGPEDKNHSSMKRVLTFQLQKVLTGNVKVTVKWEDLENTYQCRPTKTYLKLQWSVNGTTWKDIEAWSDSPSGAKAYCAETVAVQNSEDSSASATGWVGLSVHNTTQTQTPCCTWSKLPKYVMIDQVEKEVQYRVLQADKEDGTNYNYNSSGYEERTRTSASVIIASDADAEITLTNKLKTGKINPSINIKKYSSDTEGMGKNDVAELVNLGILPQELNGTISGKLSDGSGDIPEKNIKWIFDASKKEYIISEGADNLKNLPVMNAYGKKYVYTITVKGGDFPDTTTNINSSSGTTNLRILIQINFGSITAKIAWNDAGNIEAGRGAVKIQLYRDNVALGSPLELNTSNNWSHEWRYLPKHSKEGADYTYSIREVDSEGNALTEYTGENSINYSVVNGSAVTPVVNSNQTITLTNSYTPTTYGFTTALSWDDGDSATRPSEASVTLQYSLDGNTWNDVTVVADNEALLKVTDCSKAYMVGGNITQTAKASEGWAVNWSNLTAYANNGTGRTPVQYRAVTTPEGYKSTSGIVTYNSVEKKANIKNTITHLNLAITGWTYGDTANAPIASTNSGETPVIKYYTDSACTTETTSANSGAAENGAVPVYAGTYYVKATVAATTEYTAAEKVVSFVINKATLTPSIASVADKTYDKTTAGSGTIALTGGVNGDTPTATATFTWTAATAGTSKVDVTDIALDSAFTTNYELSTTSLSNQAAGKSIAKKTISVTADDKSTYVGSALVELTYTGDALYTGDTYTGALATTADKDVVNNTDITQGTLSAGDNYTIQFTKGTYTVSAKEAQTVAFSNVTENKVTKTYGDGKFTETVSGVQTTVTYSSSDTDVATVDAATGEVTIKQAGSTVITATVTENYRYLPTAASYTLTVNKIKVEVPTAVTGLSYNKTQHTGVSIPTGAVYTISGNTGTNAGSYTATVSLNDKTNYEWNLATATGSDQTISWSIAKKTISVTADDKSTYVGSDLVELTYTGDALYTGDTYTGALATTADKDVVNNTDITQGTLSAGDNYTIQFTKGTYTVSAKEAQTVAFSNVTENKVTKTYGDGKFTETVSGVQTTVTYSSSDTDVATVDAATGEVTIKQAGSTVITATVTENYRYLPTNVSYTLTVNKIKVDVPTAVTGLSYNKTQQTGVSIPTGAVYTISGNTGTNAGSYTATVSLTDKINYEWNLATATGSDQTISWSIAKASMSEGVEYTLPTGLSATCGATLGSVSLPTGFTWVEAGNTVLSAGDNDIGCRLTYYAKCNKGSNYEEKEVEIEIRVTHDLHLICQTGGKHADRCGVCEKLFHVTNCSGGTATCTDKATCSTCGQEYGTAKGHTEVTLTAKAATCTETGLTEGKKCSVCGEILVEQKTITAKGHTEVTLTAKAATCTETGLTEGKKCSVCAEILVAQQTIAAKGHDYENKEYCSVCGAKNEHYKLDIPVTIVEQGTYDVEADRKHIVTGFVTESSDKTQVEYSWWASKDGGDWFVIQNWTLGNEWLDWTPTESGDYVIVGKARSRGDDDTIVTTSTTYSYHPDIKGICQIPYEGEGGGYLIGIESYEDLKPGYTCEMMVLDCTLLMQGKDPWIYTTGRCGLVNNCLWTIWQPQYGYYWTLFRIYDENGNLVDQYCHGFENI